MKFYELPPAVNNSIQNTDISPYVRVLFELKDEDLFIPNSDILVCVITSYKSVDGGIINNGYIIRLTTFQIAGRYTKTRICSICNYNESDNTKGPTRR